ncbi:hypothetical protein LTR53_012422 [Teratosphaeriaceae sp. CCFEE 6253]|nr:hypothetical protein LTR53_012422 [Teratosphaeriaceae sp. CCFEE 6253]
MNVGPFAPSQPGSGRGFGFDAYPSNYHGQPPASYYGVDSQASSAQPASQAFSPGPHGGYDDRGHAALASTGGNTVYGQQDHRPHHTTAYPHSVPAQAPPAPAAQLPQHALRPTPTASPQPRPSPNAASPQLPAPRPPPIKHPMAAPPLPQSPATQQPGVQNASSPSPRTPLSPGSQSREQQRVALLLDINLEMLQEVNRLQLQGKGGATSPQIQAQLKAAGQPADLASEEYIQVLRRVQANLAYLMPVASHDSQKTPPGPAYMSPPPHMPQLQGKFDQLRELFPAWQGHEQRGAQASMSPRPGSVGGANGANGPLLHT